MTDLSAAIPAELRALPNWIVWKLEEVPGRPKPAKVPYSVRGGRAKTNDAATWASFGEACEAVGMGRYAGVGFVFTGTPYTGIDLDGSYGEDGALGENSAAIVAMFPGAYHERSQSKKGTHLIVRGRLPPGGRRKGPVEAYDADSPRYFALTGDVVGAPVASIPEAAGALAAFHTRWIGGVPEPEAAPAGKVAESDPRATALVDEVARAHPRQWHRLAIANEVRPGKSQSENDNELACMFAAHSREAGLIEAAMRATPAVRPKWSELHGRGLTYIRKTIAHALAVVPDPADVAAAALAGYRFLHEAELAHEPEPPWLLEGKLPAGALAVLYGPSEGGKSFLALKWSLDLARAGRRCVYVAAEGWHGTKRRVEAWRAQAKWAGPADVVFMSGAVNLMEPDQVAAFMRAGEAKAGGPVDLWVMDTLNQNMPGGDENQAGDMSAVIASANALRSRGATVLVLHHPRKADEVERGHSSLRNAADTMLKLVKDEADGHRVLSCTKQKDAAPFEDERWALVASARSMVLERRAYAGEGAEEQPLEGAMKDALDALRESGEGATKKVWQEVFVAKGNKPRNFYNVAQALIERGYVTKSGSKHDVASAPARAEALMRVKRTASAQDANEDYHKAAAR